MIDRRACLQSLTACAVVPSLFSGGASAYARSAVDAGGVQLIVPFPAGGSSAILSKHVANAYKRHTKQAMRLNYLSGGAGLLAASMAAKSAANGQTLLMGGSHLSTAHALLPDEGLDFVEDLRPLALVARIPQVLMIHPLRIRARTMAEWLAEMSRRPARYRMAAAGAGSSSHIYAQLLKQNKGLTYEFVHFRGAGPALQDLLSGTADMMMDGLIAGLPHLRSGKLKALMVTGKERSAVLPDVPCAHELGLEVLDTVTWYGVFAPAKLPDRTAASLMRVLQQLGQDEALMATFQGLGIRWGDLYGEDFAHMVMQETTQWAQTLKINGMTQLMLKNPVESLM